jgi:hypothetical protein
MHPAHQAVMGMREHDWSLADAIPSDDVFAYLWVRQGGEEMVTVGKTIAESVEHYLRQQEL